MVIFFISQQLQEREKVVPIYALDIQGIQEWTVPKTGIYRIEVWGAQGGNTTESSGGKGAYISSHHDLVAGEKIKILVGQAGARDQRDPDNDSGSGGGGTFVVKENNEI